MKSSSEKYEIGLKTHKIVRSASRRARTRLATVDCTIGTEHHQARGLKTRKNQSIADGQYCLVQLTFNAIHIIYAAARQCDCSDEMSHNSSQLCSIGRIK